MNINTAILQDQLYRKPLTIFEAMSKNITPDLTNDVNELNNEKEMVVDQNDNDMNRDYLFPIKMLF